MKILFFAPMNRNYNIYENIVLKLNIGPNTKIIFFFFDTTMSSIVLGFLIFRVYSNCILRYGLNFEKLNYFLSL
jgi:hypothetical protein